jgi:hypothetical protein
MPKPAILQFKAIPWATPRDFLAEEAESYTQSASLALMTTFFPFFIPSTV